MKPTVLISKMGAVAYTEEFSRTKRKASQSSAGEQGTTEAVVSHLLKRNDINLVYFGQWRGNIPRGMTYVASDISRLDSYTTAKEQKRRWANDVSKIKNYNPKVHVTIAGYASNCSWVDNPRLTSVQTCALRYTGPILNIIESLRLPRIVILNDIRNVPQEGEMTHGWTYIRPIAMLSQRERDWSRVILGKQWKIREVYAAAENWRNFSKLNLDYEKTRDVVVVGHAHMKTDKRLKGFDGVWRTILHDLVTLKERHGLRVYGRGWEHFSMYDSECMVGNISPAQVQQEFARSKYTPVAITGGELYTNKGRFALAQGCLPIYFGKGEPFTMDPLGKHLPLNSPYRIDSADAFLALVWYFNAHDEARVQLIKELWEKTTPDYSMLDSCIDDLLEYGRPRHDDEEWWQKYGGYRLNLD